MVKVAAAPNPYNPAGGAYARRDFLFRGVRYLRGDVFPFARLGLSETKVANLWRCQRISFGAAPRALVTEASDRRHGISPIPLPKHDVVAPAPPPPAARQPRRKPKPAAEVERVPAPGEVAEVADDEPEEAPPAPPA